MQVNTRKMALTNGVLVSPAEQAIRPVAVLQAGRHADEMATAGVETSVDDL